MTSLLTKIKPVTHFLTAMTVGMFAINEAYSHTGTTQINPQTVKTDDNLRKRILKRHNTMMNLGVSMSHVQDRFKN